MTFNTVRAFSIRPGDKVPGPLSWGGWDKRRAIEVSEVTNGVDGMIVFKLVNGDSFRAIPMNLIPFIR